MSRSCHGSDELLGISIAVANPDQTKLSAFRENLANGLQQFLLALGLHENMVAPVESPQSPIEPAQVLFVSCNLFLHP
jgi:hypothetical protein